MVGTGQYRVSIQSSKNNHISTNYIYSLC